MNRAAFLHYSLRGILFIFLFVSYHKLSSQSLLKSRKSSFYTYIYKINSFQAKQIYQNNVKELDSTFFNHKIDSFPTDKKYDKPLAEGHYLKSYSEKNQQKTSITSIQNFEAFILNNNTDLKVQVYDLQGHLINGAELKIKNKKLKFDKDEKAYIIKKANKEGLLEITVDGFKSFYQLDKRLDNSRFKRAYRKIVFGTPIKYVWRPINFALHVPIDGVKSLIRWWPQGTIYSTKEFFIKLYRKTACLFDDYYCGYYDYLDEEKYTGYFAFNKPKYKPGDTVKLKAFIVKNNGRPINKTLNAKIYSRGKKTLLGEIKPYRKGAYEHEFVLHDSLELQLDRMYNLYLESKNDKEILRSYFNYEDYELAGIKLDLIAEENNHYLKDTLKINAKGTDENNLKILDGRLEVIVTPINIHNFFSSKLFIPDTLEFIQKRLLPDENTEIFITGEKFPPVNFDYNVNVKLITSDNEIVSKNKEFSYFHSKKEFSFKLNADSIIIDYSENGKALKNEIEVYGIDNFGNKTSVFDGNTKTQIPINHYFSDYLIQTDSIQQTFNLSKRPSLIQCYSDRTTDSLIVKIENPRKIPFNYNIYKKNREIEAGYTDNLNYRINTKSKKNYFVTIQYLWGGKVIDENYEIPLKDKKLNVAVSQPRIVYPGQTSKIELTVTDINGNPAENVDLTAYSFTKKFKENAPSVPYLGKERKHKELINTFEFERNKGTTNYKQNLNYLSWKKKAGLDSIEYYQFIYPENTIRKFTYDSPDSITQFSPFVFDKGELKDIHVIYIDSRPVYFSWSTNKNPYSFNIDTGYHQLKLRTANKVLTIDSLYFNEGQKHILSIDEDIYHKNISSLKAGPYLTSSEKAYLYKYIFPYRNNFGQRMAYLKQDHQVQLLNFHQSVGSQQNFAGPIAGKIIFHSIDSYSTKFQHEPFFEYDFAPDLLKMRSTSLKSYPEYLDKYSSLSFLSDYVLTEEKLKSQWKNYLDSKRALTARYNYPTKTREGAGRLLLKNSIDKEKQLDRPLNILVFRYDNHEFLRVYPGNTALLHQLKKGYYRLLFFYEDSKYHIEDSVNIKENGLNYFEYTKPTKLKKDSFSIEINKIIEENLFKDKPYNLQEEKEKSVIFNRYREQFSYSGVGEMVDGYVYEKGTEDPLPGVNVLIKGTTFGTTTDLDGYYSLKVPLGYNTLIFTFIGMVKEEVTLNRNYTNVYLEPDVQQLSEVVVTGYGSVGKSNLTASVSNVQSNSLMRKIAGVSINSSVPGSAVEINIRGVSSQSFDKTPLYIINGLVFTGQIEDLDPKLFASLEILKGEKATAIYGSQGSNGVVIIDTNQESFKNTKTLFSKGADYDEEFFESAAQSSSIRDNFSDYAFWEPKLKTDKEGKVSFEVEFPDDVTGWETFYLAMNGKKQSGQTKSSIKSYKPLMAKLATPRFLIEGDSTLAIGKILNYTSDTISLKRQFEINGNIQFSNNQLCVNSIIDSLQIVAPSDSIQMKYFLEKEDGYLDGEQKHIPIFPRGLNRTIGQFFILDKDTTFNLEFDKNLGDVNLYARADLLEIVEDEISHVLSYEYWCNEQIASKLKALILEEKIAEYRGVKFRNEREVNKLIRLIHNNQKSDGLWGWWKNSSFNGWISLHILEALLIAEKAGYESKINKDQIAEKMIWELDYQTDFQKSIRILKILNLLNAQINYSYYINKFEQKENNNSLNALLALSHLKQLSQLEYDLDTILSFQETTLMGNIYFPNEEQENSLTQNDIQNSLLAYKILEEDSSEHKEALQKLRGYFLEIRNKGYWRNTYESAKILETILPNLLNETSDLSHPSIKLSGDVNKSIDEFPFEMTVSPDQNIKLSKSGDFPVYFTSYQSFWETKPRLKKDDFEIDTHFEENNNVLVAGEETKLIVNVTVKKDAEYVMINIPIPGGCSYASKTNNFRSESHREYFKNKTTIFLEDLPKGEHTYEIKLTPRYSGTYTLNPAKIELMYFPTFDANNEIKKVMINN
ncbi:carboxypeptidase-like regulatory domain-containing protein [Marivirga sp.]|uniref:carboxypeptidase-like regulatory domain-containing protein n=1 Tax=Marivirga sp. TaxID=2018662 RepID=UPI003DA7146E